MITVIKGESTRVDEMNEVLTKLGSNDVLESYNDSHYYGVIDGSIFSVIPVRGNMEGYKCVTLDEYQNGEVD